MSLINDALNRARAEAASNEAVQRGEIPPIEDAPRGTESRRLPPWAVIASALAAIAVVVLLASREPSSPVTEPERLAGAPTTEPERVTRPRPGAASALEENEPASATATESAQLGTNGRSASAPGRTAPEPRGATSSAEVTAAVEEPRTAETTDTPSDPTSGSNPTSDSPMPELLVTDPPSAEPIAEIRAAVADGSPPQTTSSSRPTTIWPANGPDQETWYFVGQVELAGGGVIELGGIAWSELAPSAMLNGALLTVGSEILGLRVVAIAPRTVTLSGQGQRIALQLASSTN